MPRFYTIIHYAAYGAFLAIIAALVPWYAFLVIAVAFSVLHAVFVYRGKKKRFDELLQHLKNLPGEAAPPLDLSTKSKDIDQQIFHHFREVASELEKKCYQLVEKNIQLLSMKELGLTIISSVNEEKVVESVENFLSKGLGFKELIIAIFDNNEKAFNMHFYRDALGRIDQRSELVRLGSLEYMLARAIISRRALLIRDPETHPLGSIDGRMIFGDSTMSSFVLVPMVRSTIALDCWKDEKCLRSGEEVGFDTELDPEICPECINFPILGVIGVTDGFRAEGLSNVDLVSVETLALQVSTILENTHLYNDLKKEETFRDDVINGMTNGLISADVDGEIVLVNQAAENLSGFTADELRGRSLDEIIINGGRENGKGPIERNLKSGRRSFQEEAWLVRKDGDRIPIILNTSFLLDSDGNINGILALFYDLTQIKLMEKKIAHLDKLAALGRFSSSIAHEIRNPLAGIAAGIQYIKRTSELSDEQNENISFILKEVSRIDRLIGDLMNVVKEGDLIYQKSSIEKIVEDCIKSLDELIRCKRVRINRAFPEKSMEVDIDRDRITQVFMNLIKNAVEASADGGEVDIEVSFPKFGGEVLFDRIGDYVMIKIRDRGVGLSREEKERLFEPFFSTKQNGVGLGLYVTHSFVERHGGSIFVESEKGKGTTFSVYIPTERAEHGTAGKIRHPLGG
jgi:PAS domain S-box-containing protein